MSFSSEVIHEPADTAKGIGIGLIVDAIIILIFGIVDIINKHTIDNLDYLVSGAIVIVTAIICLVSGAVLYKGKKVGVYLAWISAAITIVLGAVLTFNVVPNTMFLGVYYFVTGVFLIFYLLTSKNLKELK